MKRFMVVPILIIALMLGGWQYRTTNMIESDTYSAAITGLATAVSATDVFTLTGSATKTIRVTKVEVSGIATAAGAFTIQLLKRSTADTAGTSSTPTRVPHDSTSGAATATVLAYTANPTTGNLIGLVGLRKITLTTAAGGLVNVPQYLDYTRNEKAVILRGTSEVLAVNLNGVTVTGGAFDVAVTWTEE